MKVRAFLIVGAVAAAGLLGSAAAENIVAANAVDGVVLTEPKAAGASFSIADGFTMEFNRTPERRAAAVGPTGESAIEPGRRRVEVAAVAHDLAGLPLDVSLNQRATLRVSPDGDIHRAGDGAEVRVGNRLSGLTKQWDAADWSSPNWYFYAASDNEQLSWSPRVTSGSSVRYREDRVRIGDMQAGFALEAGGVQAAIAYVQRDIQGRYGSAEENFTGVTVSWRR
jgi:hypothetical protein